MANNPTLGFRVSPELYGWLGSLRSRAGYPGTEAARVLLEVFWRACSTEAPDYPLEIAVQVRRRSGHIGTAHIDRSSAGEITPGIPAWATDAGLMIAAEESAIEPRPLSDQIGKAPAVRSSGKSRP